MIISIFKIHKIVDKQFVSTKLLEVLKEFIPNEQIKFVLFQVYYIQSTEKCVSVRITMATRSDRSVSRTAGLLRCG